MEQVSNPPSLVTRLCLHAHYAGTFLMYVNAYSSLQDTGGEQRILGLLSQRYAVKNTDQGDVHEALSPERGMLGLRVMQFVGPT
jgi:hypothetical protein